MDKIQKQFKREQNQLICEIAQMMNDFETDFLEEKGLLTEHKEQQVQKEITKELNKMIKECKQIKIELTNGFGIKCIFDGIKKIKIKSNHQKNGDKTQFYFMLGGIFHFYYVSENSVWQQIKNIKQKHDDLLWKRLQKIKEHKLTYILQNQKKMKNISCRTIMETFQKINQKPTDKKIIERLHYLVFILPKRKLFERQQKLDSIMADLYKQEIEEFDYDPNYQWYDYETDCLNKEQKFTVEFQNGEGISISFENEYTIKYNFNGFCGSQFYKNPIINQVIKIYNAYVRNF